MSERDKREGRQGGSFLVRIWWEPREEGDETAELRAYVRELQTGEERYYSNPARLGEDLVRQLERRREREDRSKRYALAAEGEPTPRGA